MNLLYEIFIWGFLIALVAGAVANKTSFCTMGAVSDWVNMGDLGRMRSWLLAIAVAILGVTILHSISVLDITLTANGETGKPPYSSPQFVWLRYIIGGLLFGIGMTLGSGCGNKTMVRIGGGNAKSIVVFVAMGIGAYLMIFTDFDQYVFLQWMQPLALNFTDYGINSQSLSDILGKFIGGEGADLRQISGIVIGALLFSLIFRLDDMREQFDNILGGFVMGIAVVAAWYVTAGPVGQELLAEVEFFDTPPRDVGAQSFTFVKPSAHLFYYIQTGFAPAALTFALVLAFGVTLGSLIYSLVSRKFRFEWFNDLGDFLRHVTGGVIMGIGGVLALGCTFGQAITGASTLAAGSFITFIFIVIGAALTMKIQYYQMVYEEEASFFSALIASLADLHLLPGKWRRLNPV